MKKLLLVLLVTSITGAFAAISWNCSSDDMKQSYLPSGCKSTLSSDVVTPSAPVTPATPPASVIKSKVSYNASVFDGLGECSSNTSTTSNSANLSLARDCADNWIKGKTFPPEVDLGVSPSPICISYDSLNSACGFEVISDSGLHSIYALPFNSSTVDSINAEIPSSSTNKLPSTGGVLCKAANLMDFDSSLCPAGSYTRVLKKETITGPDGRTFEMNHFDGYVLVQ